MNTGFISRREESAAISLPVRPKIPMHSYRTGRSVRDATPAARLMPFWAWAEKG
jgi:hypothetical protein